MLLNIEIITELPIAISILCLLLGFLYAFILYRKETKFSETKNWLKKSMFVARCVVVSILAFLLLSPFIKSVFNKVEKPTIVLVHDNSSSVIANKDSSFYKGEYLTKLDELSADLEKDYDVKSYTFSDELREGSEIDYNGKVTDLSKVFNELNDKFYNQNLGAIVLATDGIYNQGSNPVFTAKDLGVPIYAIALGDTSVQKDFVISKAISNKITFLGNEFPVRVEFNSALCLGENTELEILHNGKKLWSKKYTISEEQVFVEEDILLEATTVGIQQYQIRLKPVEGEISYVNNEKDIFIEVLDGRQEVLILYEGPHPDVKALQQSISQNENYKVTVTKSSDFDGNTEPYSLVVFHQVRQSRWMKELMKKDIPYLLFLDANSNVGEFNSLQTGLSLKNTNGKVNQIGPIYSDAFPLFNLSETALERLEALPPIVSLFGAYDLNKSNHSLFYQRIGSVTTKAPLLTFFYEENTKIGVFSGEGIWRWKMYEYQEYKNTDAFDEWVQKTIQFLSVKEDKSKFRVAIEKNNSENDAIVFDAELYNENYELVNEPIVKLNLKNESDEVFNYEFNKSNNAYSLNIGVMPSGKYSYSAITNFNDKELNESGVFVVKPLQIEAENTVANHQLLVNLTSKNNGKLFYPTQLDELKKEIVANKNIVPVIYENKELKELINLKFIFFLLIGLLSLEWFIRKRNGAY